jgi:hypothetical protein
MASTNPKPLFWLLEEATPEVAQLMHQLERSLGAAGAIQRVSYTDALRALPREQTRLGISAIICFSLPSLINLASLLKSYPGQRPRLCFFPSNFEALAVLRSNQRWPLPVSAIARHAGEAYLYELSGLKPENIVRLQVEVDAAQLPEGDRPTGRPIRIGFAWHNLAPAQREAVATAIARWRQRSPDRFDWLVSCLPGQGPTEEEFEGVTRYELGPTQPTPEALDVLLSDPWWPDVLPRPWRAPATVHLPPGGLPGDGWEERLQGLIDLGDHASWEAEELLAYAHQPLWRHLLKGEERQVAAPVAPDLNALVGDRACWQTWLEQERERWASDGPPEALDLAFFFNVYDYRVQISWCHDLWGALAAAQTSPRNAERHALVLAFNALALHHTNSAWLFKRLMAATGVGRADAPRRKMGRRFWLGFAMRHSVALAGWLRMLGRCGRHEDVDPLAATRAIGKRLLDEAQVEVVRRNEPSPEAGVPTLYLMSHRHGELDPFLLLEILPKHLAVVVGPRAQRWPLLRRLGHSSAFVLTGRERGVVIADAIAAVRAKRALALYPEVAEPTYLGEGAPLRAGLLWIVQALERSQVIPVVLDDAFALGPGGGRVEVWFGDPIAVTPDTSEGLLERVRMFYHQHVVRMNMLDGAVERPQEVWSRIPKEETPTYSSP